MHDQDMELVSGGRWTRPRFIGPLVLGILALMLAAGLASDALRTQSTAFPLPSPYYTIVGNSGPHQISLLNLPVPYIGVPQVPVPVDVNGDLLPDVTVSLNLVNVPEGLLHNPPDLGDLIAPNLEINRLLTAPILGQPSPPLRLEVRYEIRDLEGGPSTTIQAGYDTGPGGTIPTYWKALLGGLSDFFNPLTVLLDTRPPLPNQWVRPTYRGPHAIVGQVELPDQVMDFNLHYDPLPDQVRVSLATDDEGTHVTYDHTAPRDVDLTTTIAQDAVDGSSLDIEARVDRLPDDMAVDIFTDEGGVGDLVYRSNSDGRAPDIGAHIVSVPATGSGDNPIVVDADIEGLPPEMHAHWELPEGGPASFDFDSPYNGIGAIQAEVRDYLGTDPAPFTFVPTEQQFVSFHQAGPQSLIRARVERVNEVHFDEVEDGVDASMRIGDGQLPLEVKVVHDNIDEEGTALDAGAVLSPLPRELNVSFRTPDPGETGVPMTVHYDTGATGQTADVDANLRIVEPGTAPTTCGTPGVTCANLGVRHLPASMDISLVNVTELDSRVDVDMTPRPGSAEPDVFADVILAQKGEAPAPDPDPIVADVSIFGLPEHMRVRLVNRIADEGTTTEREAFERVEFHACEWDYGAGECPDGDPPDRIDAIDFAFRNFTEGDLPPLLPDTPLWVTVVGRGQASPTATMLFEAAAHLTDIGEVQLLTNDDLKGLRTDVGGGQNLSATVDIEGLPVVFEEATDDDPAIHHRLDIDGVVRIEPLPQFLDFCFQQKDRPVPDEPTAEYTEACQDDDPFGDEDGPGGVDKTPLGLAWAGTDSNGNLQEFDVKTTVELVERGDEDTLPDVESDDQHVRGRVDVLHLPGTFEAFVSSPPDDADGNPTEGPLHVVYNASAPITDQIEVDFGLEVTDADFLCKDPRHLPVGKSAICADAVIRNLPESLTLFYDETLPADNFRLHTSGEFQVDIEDVDISMVKGELVDRREPPTPENQLDDTHETTVMIVDAEILDLPRGVDGTLRMPGTVDLRAQPEGSAIGEIEATVQNFIAPDPLPDDVPAQRAGLNAADHQFSVFQRDRHFRASAFIQNVRGVAFAASRDIDNPNKLLDTNTIRVAFGDADDTVRAYADLMFFSERNPDGSPIVGSLSHVIGDVTLEDVPEEVTLCIRGEKTIAGTPADPTFCDTAPENDSEGAFSFVGEPDEPTTLLDVYGFLRYAKAGGTDVLAARIDMVDIPHVVQGRFRTDDVTGKRVEFSTFADVNETTGVGQTPMGIGAIDFDFANFDIDTHGYPVGPPLPWGAFNKAGTVDPFPAAPAGQHVRLHLNNSDVHVRGRLFDLQGVLFDEDHCDAPSDPAPDSYPYYPETLGDQYTCVRAQFQDDSTDRLDLVIRIDKDGQHIGLENAGFSDIPRLLQATIAESAELDPSPSADPEISALRDPCPFDKDVVGSPDCMPPMLRLDTSGDAVLFGQLQVGSLADLDGIEDFDGLSTTADLDELPEGWSDFGARVRVVQWGKASEATEDDDRTAITAGLRIQVPESFTLDQVQSWDSLVSGSLGEIRREAKDIRLHYAVREDSGGGAGGPDQVVTTIGELTALIHDADKGGQVIASAVGAGNEDQGLPIPGELGIELFMRNNVVPEGKCPENDTPQCHDNMFMQINGRSSAELDARIRIHGGSDAAIQDISAELHDLPDTDGIAAGANSFAARIEMDKNVPKDPSAVEEALLCIVYCVQTLIAIDELTAVLDFNPSNSSSPSAPARRLDAYIVLDGADNAVELRGYSNTEAAVGAAGDREIDASVHLGISPMLVYLHLGLNPIAGFDLFLGGELMVDAVIDNAREFRINNSILHVVLEHRGTGTGSFVDVNLHVYGLVAASFLWLFFIPPIPLYVATFLPPSLPPPTGPPLGSAKLQFVPCPGSDGGSFGNTLSIGADENIDVGAWFNLLLEPRYIRFGLLVLVVDLLAPVIFCAVGGDIPLMDASHPGPTFKVPNHPVDGIGAGFTPAPPPTPPVVAPPELVVEENDVVELCGKPALTSVIIEEGGILRVATAENTDPIPYVPPGPGEVAAPSQPMCVDDPDDPDDGPGTLELNAGALLEVNGTLEGPDNGDNPVPAVPERLIVTADHIKVDDNVESGDPEGEIVAGTAKVTLQTNGTINVEGFIRADEVIDANTSGATGGGGAGHGGTGGAAGFGGGGGGGAYGDQTFTPLEDDTDPVDPDVGRIPIESGAAGSSPGAGHGPGGMGGGQLYLQATVITVSGAITANGGVGSDNIDATLEHCSVDVHYPDSDPAPDVTTEHTDSFPNNGRVGSGGGSGGGIFLRATKVDFVGSGVIEATGGDGGHGYAGGGGGGSGGLIKASVAIIDGDPDVSGGDGGSADCPTPEPTPDFFPTDSFGEDADGVAVVGSRPAERPVGGDGDDDLYLEEIAPFSSATPLEAFWNNAKPGALLDVPYAAAFDGLNGTNSEIYLCGLRRPPESFFIDDEDPASGNQTTDDEDPNDIDMATGATFAQPCGTSVPDTDDNFGADSPTTLHQLGMQTLAGDETLPTAKFQVDLSALGEGYWAFYTVMLVHTGGDVANSCTNPGDFGGILGFLYDLTNCELEVLPEDPDIASGIDNTNPEVTIEAPPLSDEATVTVEVSGIADNMDVGDSPEPGVPNPVPDPIPNFSGVVRVECAPTNTPATVWVECGTGFHQITFAGNGDSIAFARVTDVAGNVFVDESDPVTVDNEAPSSTAVSDPVAPASGWYSEGPEIHISGFNDNGGSGLPESGFPYEWWVDGGEPQVCNDLVMGVDPDLDPTTCTVDLAPVLSTGQHVFHFRAVDKAGNKEDGLAAENTIQVNVDNEAPEVELLVVPDPQDGENGWYQMRPFAVVSGVDQPGASGLIDIAPGPAGVFYGIDDASTAADDAEAAAPHEFPPPGPDPFLRIGPGHYFVHFRAVDVAGNPTATLSREFFVDDAAPTIDIISDVPDGLADWHITTTQVELDVDDADPGSGINSLTDPSGIFMSVDGAELQDYTGPFTVGEGLHSIVAYAVDVSGQSTPIVEREFSVDLSPPVSVHRATPPLPARNNWWRTIPSNVLRATDGDQNAGVADVIYRRNAEAFGSYSQAFDLNPGSTTLEWRAIDRAGLNEPLRSRVMLVDPSPPTAKALNGPLLFIRSQLLHILLGLPLDAPLKWQISDSLSGKVHVTVNIYNLIGQVVRVIDHGVVNVTPGVTFNGQTLWDGRPEGSLSALVSAGVYYYRIIATDDAGNTAQSGESKPITITITLL